MDEVFSLVDKVKREARERALILSAILLPEPMAVMLKMYCATYGKGGSEIAPRKMTQVITNEPGFIFGVPCIAVPNLADVNIVLNAKMACAKDFLAWCEQNPISQRVRRDESATLLEASSGTLLEVDNG